MKKLPSVVAVLPFAALIFLFANSVFAQNPYLGEAEKFGVLSEMNVLSNTATEVKGWVGAKGNIDNQIISTDPISLYVSSPCEILAAVADFVQARQDLHNKVAVPIGKNINDEIFGPGVYEVQQPAQMGGTIKLQGGATDEFVFNFKQNLTIKPNTKIELLGGVKPENVYFNAETQISIGTNSEIHGNFLAGGSINAINLLNAEESRLHGGGNVNLGGIPKTGLTAISNVFPMPQPTITASGATTFCQGGSVVLTANNGAKAYQWNTGATTQSITVTQSGTYTVTVTFQNNCTANTSQQVIVNPFPTANAGNDATIFSGESVQIGSASVSGNSYLWNPSTGLSAPNISNTIASPESTTTYILTVQSASGCINKDTVTITAIKCSPVIDTISCRAPDSSGIQSYDFTLNIFNSSNSNAALSVSSQNFTITSISSQILTPGTNTITGIFSTNSPANTVACFQIEILFQNAQNGTDTCLSQLCFIMPNCAENVCGSNVLQNGTLANSNVPGTMSGTGSIANWSAAYGNPVAYNTDGCDESGFVKMYGNKSEGSAIKQTVSTEQGKRYMLSFCARLDASLSNVPYLKFRAIAFNGTLPAGNEHPEPNTDISIIGISGKITTTDWTYIEFFPWLANYDFSNIAINVYNNFDVPVFSFGDIDGICLKETTEDFPCDSIPTDSLGNPIIPADLAALLDPNNPPVTDTVDMFMGYVSDLYTACCGPTATDTFYYDCPCLDCATIGGTVPNEALNLNLEDSLAAMGFTLTSDSINSIYNFISDSIYNSMLNDSLFTFPSLGLMDSLCECDTVSIDTFSNANDPFQGMDIVYVHGFMPETIFLDKILGLDEDAYTVWPLNKKEFYDDYRGNGNHGYWKGKAKEQMGPLIDYFFTNPRDAQGNPMPPHKNRYLVTAWASTQTLEFAVHTVLTQISEAMINGQGVIYHPSDPRKKQGFGKNGYVIISGSTGALVTNVAMSLANQTKTYNSPVRLALGPIGYISDRAKVHISLHGAISGSHLATAAYALFSIPQIQGAAAILNYLISDPFDPVSVLTAAYAYYGVQTSILRDLVPPVSQTWMTLIGQFTPVPVLTVAGGHPDYKTFPLKHLLHPGFDDGVLTMDCQCGNFNPYLVWPSGYIPEPSLIPHSKVYDMGLDQRQSGGRERAIEYYTDQFVEQKFKIPFTGANVSAACTPALSPTGMVQPVLVNNFLINSRHRYLNHYSFLQSASDHLSRDTAEFPYYIPTMFQKARNFEETLCIKNDDVYDLGLVNPSIKNLMQEDVLGANHTITIPVGIVSIWPFKIKTWSKTFWIWKRTYHRLYDFENMTEFDYVFKYVLKQ